MTHDEKRAALEGELALYNDRLSQLRVEFDRLAIKVDHIIRMLEALDAIEANEHDRSLQ